MNDFEVFILFGGLGFAIFATVQWLFWQEIILPLYEKFQRYLHKTRLSRWAHEE